MIRRHSGRCVTANGAAKASKAYRSASRLWTPPPRADGLTACRIWRAKYPASTCVVRSRAEHSDHPRHLLDRRHHRTVGFYLDDTPMQASSNAAQLSARGVFDPALFDLARVEVLARPQGTLYGSSSMGGTINVCDQSTRYRRPSRRAAARRSPTRTAAVPNVEQIGTVNLPLSDIAAARITAFYRTTMASSTATASTPQLSQYQSGAGGPRVIPKTPTGSGRGEIRGDPRPHRNAFGDFPGVPASAVVQYRRAAGKFHDLIQARDTAEPTTRNLAG